LHATIINPLQIHGNVETETHTNSNTVSTFIESQNACKDLWYHGVVEWRLPTQKELSDLLDAGFVNLGYQGKPLPVRGRVWASDSLSKATADTQYPGAVEMIRNAYVFDLFPVESVKFGPVKVVTDDREYYYHKPGAPVVGCGVSNQDPRCINQISQALGASAGYICVKSIP
jgi:hypothetical protein